MKKIVYPIAVGIVMIAASTLKAAAPIIPPTHTSPMTQPTAPINTPYYAPQTFTTPPTSSMTQQAATEHDLDNYVNALVKKLYKESNLQYINTTNASHAAQNPAEAQQSFASINKQAINLAAALQRAYNPPTVPNAVLSQANEYKARLFDLLRNLAINNMAAVNQLISSLPDPLPDPLYPPITTPLTYNGYLGREYNDILYQTMLQVLVHNANLFPNISKAEIDAFIATIR
ncbi:MAG TPA: hypothetical protein VGT41_04280 [Candidatus Babeliales bacterium]|nr:hypothetical protein [Candidatus Babeliales bacterium]